MAGKTEENQAGLTVSKEKDFSEWYTQVVQKAELADIRYGVQGFIVHMPWGFRILRRIYEYFEEEVEKDGHQPFLFPLVIKKESLEKEKEHAGFAPDVFWVTRAGDRKLEEEVALRPTGETQIYPLYSLWIRSYQDLPYKGYQSRICTYRNEKTTRPFLRGREFMFFETHDAFAAHDEAIEQIRKDSEMSLRVLYQRCKIPFLFFKRPQWDKFKGADDTFTSDTMMPDGKRNQLSSTHDLGQNFAKAYEIKFHDANSGESYAWQTCYGPGIWRTMAALIGIHGDDKGLVLPFDLAPVQVVIVPIIFADKKSEAKNVLELCKKIEKQLKSRGYRALVDASNETPGFKYNKWELKGVPLRIEIGPKEVKKSSICLSFRTRKEKKDVPAKGMEKEISNAAQTIDKDIQKRADAYFKDNTRYTESYDELKSLLKKYRGFIKTPFCSVDDDGEPCADKLKEETEGAYVCGTIYPKEEKLKDGQKCVVCHKKANHLVHVAKSY